MRCQVESAVGSGDEGHAEPRWTSAVGEAKERDWSGAAIRTPEAELRAIAAVDEGMN